MGWEGYVACMWVKWNAYRDLLGKSEGETTRRKRNVLEDDFKMDLR
jgi:hypothetical protein